MLYGSALAESVGARFSSYPSQEFQEKHLGKFKEDIYKIYKMPYGYTDKYNASDQLSVNSSGSNPYERFGKESLLVVFDELLMKNKELKIFGSYRGDKYGMYTVFAGVCSRFLPEDIKFFIENVSSDFDTTELHSDMADEGKAYGLSFIPSPHTLKIIKESLGEDS
jgi:hypothetical protein